MGGCLNKPSNAQAAKKQEDHTNKKSASGGIQLESTSVQGSSSSKKESSNSDATVNALHSSKENESSQNHTSDNQKAHDVATNEPSQLRESMSFRKSNLADVSIISSSSEEEDNHSGEHDSIRLSTFEAKNGESNDTKNPMCDELSPRPSLLEILAQEVDSDDDEDAPPRAVSFSTPQLVSNSSNGSKAVSNADTTTASAHSMPSKTTIDPEDDRLTLSTQVNAKMWVQSASVLYQQSHVSIPEEGEDAHVDNQLAGSKEGDLEVRVLKSGSVEGLSKEGESVAESQEEKTAVIDGKSPPAHQPPSAPSSPPPTLPASPPTSSPPSVHSLNETTTDQALAADAEVPAEEAEDEDEDEDDFGMRSPLHQLSQRISDHNVLHQLQQPPLAQSSPLVLSHRKKRLSAASDASSADRTAGEGADAEEAPAVLSPEERLALQSFFGVHTNATEASRVVDEAAQEDGSLRRFDSYGATLLPQRSTSTSTSFSASFSQHPHSSRHNAQNHSRLISDRHNASTYSIASEAEDEVEEYSDNINHHSSSNHNNIGYHHINSAQQQKEMSMSAQSLLSAFANIDDNEADDEAEGSPAEEDRAKDQATDQGEDLKEDDVPVERSVPTTSFSAPSTVTESVTTADHYSNTNANTSAIAITDSKEQTESKAADATTDPTHPTDSKDQADSINADVRGATASDTTQTPPEAAIEEPAKKEEPQKEEPTKEETVAVAVEEEDDSNYAGFAASSASALPRFQLNQLGGARGGAKQQKSAEELAHEENKRAHFARLGRAALVTTTLPSSSSSSTARDDGAGDMHRTNNATQNSLLRVRSNNSNPAATSSSSTQKLGASALLGGRGGARGGAGRGRFGTSPSATTAASTATTASTTATTAAASGRGEAASEEADRAEEEDDLFDVYASNTSKTAPSSSVSARGGVRGGAQAGVRSISMDSSSAYLAALQREVVDEGEEDSVSILAALNHNSHSAANSTNSTNGSDGTSSVSRTVALFNSRGGGARGGGSLLQGRGGARGGRGRGSA